MDLTGTYHEETTKTTLDNKQLKDICIAKYDDNECGCCLIYSSGAATEYIATYLLYEWSLLPHPQEHVHSSRCHFMSDKASHFIKHSTVCLKACSLYHQRNDQSSRWPCQGQYGEAAQDKASWLTAHLSLFGGNYWLQMHTEPHEGQWITFTYHVVLRKHEY